MEGEVYIERGKARLGEVGQEGVLFFSLSQIVPSHEVKGRKR